MVNREEIKRRRLALQLTLDEAAKRAGFGGRQRWFGLEAGERTGITAETLWAVAKVLGCSMDDLMKPDPPRQVTAKTSRQRAK